MGFPSRRDLAPLSPAARGAMGPLWPLLLLGTLLLSALPAARCTACPQKCRCEDLQFYCDTQGLRAPPDGVDRGALGLSLRHNAVGELGPDQFYGFAQLTWLHLDHNQITGVREDAFQGLYKLKDLNLSSNRIARLPNTTFVHLVNLQILDLSFNQLTALEPELFHGLRKLQILHLRSNSLRTTPVRAFWDCRSLEYLGLGNNRLRSLARNGFAGLVKLRELHLEHNQLTRVNLAHFPRLVALQFLHLQWNKIANLTCGGMEWQWATLERLDLTGNELRALTPDVFLTLPGLRALLLDNNRLSSLEAATLDTWRSLSTVGLSANLWECSRRICPLAAWLGAFRGRWEHAVLCHSPEYAQGEEILDAVYGFQLCQNFSSAAAAAAGGGLGGGAAPAAPAGALPPSSEAPPPPPREASSDSFGIMHTPTQDFYAEDFRSSTTVAAVIAPDAPYSAAPDAAAASAPPPPGGAAAAPATPRGSGADRGGGFTAAEGGPEEEGAGVTDEEEGGEFSERDNTVLTQRVIIGTMALLFSFFLIIFGVYVSRKCCPPTLRRIRHCSAMQARRQMRTQARQPMADLATQVPYNEYEPSHEEGALVIINGYGQCKCQQLPYKECEV